MPRKCTIWSGRLDYEGYAVVPCKVNGKLKIVRAARALWIGVHGPIAEGLVIRHLCHNRACVNLHHLATGTHKENSADQRRNPKNFGKTLGAPPGELHGNAKLTDEKVRQIKIMLPLYSNAYLAGMYDVTASCIHSIRIGRTWKHISTV